MLLIFCLTTFAVQGIFGLESINTNEPIIREAPASLDSDGYFGFSAVLHRVSDNPQSFDEYLSSTRIVVSAPNGSAANSMVDNTGVMYTCTIEQGSDRFCTPLLGDGEGDDRFLYDELDNNGDEDKHKQFLGVTMDSADNMFVVCAHRYFEIPTSTRYPRGRCFYTTNRDLTGFNQYAPCEGLSFDRFNGYGQCQGGTSAVLADDNTESDSDIIPIVVGAPGSQEWRGTVFRRRTSGTTDSSSTGEGTNFYSWQGYAMTKGHFISKTREDIAVSVPRISNYFGQVNIIRNNNGLDYEGQTLTGTTQMGEYYGFSLAAADLNGDGYDELLVGAPMYSPTGVPEAGQVYLYKNNQGNLEVFRLITAPVDEEYARFGHSITNLGDINGDGLDDVAIGAPFGSGSGTVYVYYGSVADTITPSVQQTITGSDITDDLQSVESPKGFGYSLSSLLDVDGNGINDLLIGAYASQQVFLLRSHAVANIPTTISASPNIINLDELSCRLGNANYSCFMLTACATLPNGDSFSDSIELSFTFIVDRQNTELGLQQRVFFNNPERSTIQNITRLISQGEETCIEETVYIFENINDRLNGFPVEFSIDTPVFMPSSANGNPVPTNLASFPIIVTTGQSFVQVETFKDCEGQVCIPDLDLALVNITYETSSGSNPTSFVSGEVTNFNIWMTLTNRGEDAFLTSISFAILTAQFEFIRILPRDFLITCTSEVGNERTVLTCPIANPLSDSQSRTIAVRLRPTSGLRPSEGPFSFTFTANSLNDELNTTLSNNEFTEVINVAESADIFLDQAMANPEQISYTTTNVSVGNLTVPEDLGPPVTVSYVVRNAGPSTVPETKIRIFWPLREAENEFYYLYPSQIQRSLSNSIDCTEEYINPLDLSIQSVQDEDQEGEETFGSDKRRRRRSISPLRRKKRAIEKRQSLEAVDEVAEVTINCRTNPEMCREITCTIRQLVGGSSVQIDVVSHLDERYFQSRTDRFTFVPYANISIVSEGSNIQQPVDHRSDETEVQIRAVTSVPPPRTRDSSVAPWIIIVPIILGVLFFVILGVILYFVGFFRRKNKQKKEEIAAQFLEAQQGGDTFDDVPPTADSA